MSDNKITDYTSVSKSNHKILKFITIILSILIVICLFFLIIGFINKFGKLEKKENSYNKKTFIYNFMSSMRQKINDPLGKRVKQREKISQR